jgi:hypothetical protein
VSKVPLVARPAPYFGVTGYGDCCIYRVDCFPAIGNACIYLKEITREIIMKNFEISAIVAATVLLTSGAVFAQNAAGNAGSPVPNDQTNYPNKANTGNSTMQKSWEDNSSAAGRNDPGSDSAREVSQPKSKGPMNSKGPN